MENTPTLYTPRLCLRRFTTEDREALYEILRDREVNTFLPWFPAQSPEEAGRFLQQRFLQVYRLPQGCQYAICLREENRPIGYLGVDLAEPHDLGYGLHRAFWGQGLAFEAAAAVLEQLRRDGLPYVTATHDRNNPRSGAVMRRLGMRYRYSYEERWQPKDLLVTFRMYQLNLDGVEERVYRGYWDAAQVKFVEEGL